MATCGWEIPAGQREEHTPHMTQSKDSSAHLSEFTALRISDVLHDVEVLRAALRAGIAAADASINFRIKLHHDLLGGFDFLDIVDLFDQRKNGSVATYMSFSTFVWHARQVFQFAIAFDAVDCRTRTAEPIPAAASATSW